MKPETRTVNQLFELDVRYVVPLYQRPYVWDETKQWEPLWEDILVVLHHQLGNGAAPASYSHFLGAIVLEQETQAPGKIPLFTVIDGQQRLTTLQLLLAAAKVVAANLGAANEADILGELIVNNPKKAERDERLKVWPTNINRKAFQTVLAPDGGAGAPDDPKNLIQEAYHYFGEKIAEWASEGPDDERADRLRTLRVALSELLKVVSITLEADDNAQIIFETLNARGTPLLALDLVKNSVFLEATRLNLPADSLYEEVWRPQLDAGHWRAQRRQGRLFRAQGELFLMHWLGMKLRKLIPATELFSTFRKDILGAKPAPDLSSLIHEMNRDAGIYASFDDQPAGSPEAHFFERLETLDITTLMPLVLLLFTAPEVSQERRRRALALLESWLVRRMLVRLTTKNYNAEVAQMIGKVSDAPEKVDEVLKTHLLAGAAATDRWPTDEDVIEALTTRDLYYAVPQARIAMVLRAVELSLYNPKVDLPQVPRTLSIEHLMPQKWQEYWALPDDLGAEQRADREAQRAERIHKLGNLTLITQPMNSGFVNREWQVKQKELNRGSKLLLNSEVLEAYPQGFDESSIDARSQLLARRICRIWPRPTE